MAPKTQHQERHRSREAALQVLFSAHFAVGGGTTENTKGGDGKLARRLRHHYQMHLGYVPALVDELLGDIAYEGLPQGRAEVLRQEARALLEEALGIAYSIGYVEEVERAVERLDKHLDSALRDWRIERRALTNPESAPEALATDSPLPAALVLPDLVKRWTSGWTRNRQQQALEQTANQPTVFTQQLLNLVETHCAQLDGLIDGSLQGWSPERLGVAERSLLRLGAAELLHCAEIPAAATIDEYVELARDYADDKSAKFINGVLDRLRIEHAPSAKARPAPQAKASVKGSGGGHA